MRNRTFIVCTVLCSLALNAGILAAGSVASGTMGAHSVTLADASSAPSVLRMVRPGRSYTPPSADAEGRPCSGPSWPSDVSAYQWNGRALGPQTWSERLHNGGGIGYYWRARMGRVEYDGLTFYNDSRAAVLVAFWCGA